MSLLLADLTPRTQVGGNDAYAVFLLHCDGADGSTTFGDASGSAHGYATVNGGAQVDTAQSQFGGSALLLNGGGDYLTYANHTDWNLGTNGGGDFTIDFWVRFATIDSVANNLINADAVNGGWQIYNNASTMRVWNGPGTDRGVSWSAATGVWYHVAIVRAGSIVTIYVNGASIGTVSDGDFNNDGTGLNIGGATSGYTLNGWMDEVRISKGIARWTANFTPPTAPYS